jgi:DNA-binding NarL/FixJ family response regulator
MGVICGHETMRLWLEASGGSSLPQKTCLLIDIPWGHALAMLPSASRPALVITENRSPAYLRDILELNPEGLVCGPMSPDEITRALARVAAGEQLYIGPPLTSKDSISPRERQVLGLVVEGLENQEIARRLGIHKRTVANLVSSLRDKVGVRNRVELVLYYFGTISPYSSE